MLRIKVEQGNIEKALKQYKRKVNNTKQTKKLREDRYHEKDPASNRKKLSNAKYLQSRKDQSENQ